MKISNSDYYNANFSHIYVEKKVANHKRTKKILEKFPQSTIVMIDHYKDVFNRKKQSGFNQSKAKSLILAYNENGNIYEGAPVCQSFGNENFYYCSCMMNCIFDCEYCYLKGMYPTSNILVFVNLEDTFAQLEKMLEEKEKDKSEQKSVYLCVSYDADLVACESLFGLVKDWIDFTKIHENLTIEIRTKSGRTDLWQEYESCDRVILAFTMSPEKIASQYEHFAAPLSKRIAAAKAAMENGFNVRLCFDPMIYCPGWEAEYDQMINDIFSEIKGEDLWDVSIGSFRISQDYLKKMRRDMPLSSIVNFPYDNVDGYYQYPEKIRVDMENHLTQKLVKYIDSSKIFLWK